VHSGATSNAFLDALRKASPDTAVLVDEAYQDYVSDANRSTQIPRAIADPNVIVARTFSKAYGMAGVRLGIAIAHVDTIRRIQAWEGFGDIPWGLPALEAGLATVQLDDSFVARERARNTEAREFTRKFFTDQRLTATDSETNFIFVDTQRPIAEFQKACATKRVRVGRPFPPLMTHARISIGTIGEMRRATAVFADVLRTVRHAG
jgi:histidinol-phosphate aminotransferase